MDSEVRFNIFLLWMWIHQIIRLAFLRVQKVCSPEHDGWNDIHSEDKYSTLDDGGSSFVLFLVLFLFILERAQWKNYKRGFTWYVNYINYFLIQFKNTAT